MKTILTKFIAMGVWQNALRRFTFLLRGGWEKSNVFEEEHIKWLRRLAIAVTTLNHKTSYRTAWIINQGWILAISQHD